MADFKFYLNRQGVRGAKGEKGDKGFSPSIEVGKNTQEEFTLMIVNEDGTVETPNIKEGLVPEDRGGTYVRKDPTTGLQYYGSADLGTVDNIGEVQLASTQDLENTQIGDVEPDGQPAKGKAVDGLAAVEFFASNKNLSTVSQEVQNLSTEIGSIKNEQAKQNTEIQSNASDIANLNIDVNNLKTNKQNKLKAGDNIILTDNPDGTTTVASTGGGGGTGGDVTAAGDNTFTGSNTFTSTTTFNAPIAVSSGGSTIETSFNEQTSTYIDLKVNSQADLILGAGTVVIEEADGTTYIRDGRIKDASGNILLSQGNITAGNNITITKTAKGIKIDGSGGGGGAPANMVTTDTDQDITGVKRFLNNRQDLSKPAIKIGNYAVGQDTYDSGYITSASNYLEIGSYYATNSKGGFLSINSTSNSSIFKITSNDSNINPRLQLGMTNYEGEIYNDIAEGLCLSNHKYNYDYPRGILKIKDDTLTFKKTDGTVVDLLAGGGSSEPPANMVTTDTDQFITGTKSFYGSINLKGSETDNYYSMITNTGGSIKLQAQYGNPAGLHVGVSSLTYTDASGIDHNLLSSGGGATINDSAASDTSTYSSSKIEKLTNITSSDASISVTKSDTGIDIVINKNEWVYVNKTLLNNVDRTTENITVDLSDSLPNDGATYDVLFSSQAQPTVEKNKFIAVLPANDKITPAMRVSQGRVAVAGVDASVQGAFLLPITSSRSMSLGGSSSSNNGGTITLYMHAYKKVG